MLTGVVSLAIEMRTNGLRKQWSGATSNHIATGVMGKHLLRREDLGHHNRHSHSGQGKSRGDGLIIKVMFLLTFRLSKMTGILTAVYS